MFWACFSLIPMSASASPFSSGVTPLTLKTEAKYLRHQLKRCKSSKHVHKLQILNKTSIKYLQLSFPFIKKKSSTLQTPSKDDNHNNFHHCSSHYSPSLPTS